MSESEVRLKLTEQEAKRADEGSFSLHIVGTSAFMTQLLEVQELQYAFTVVGWCIGY